MEGAEPFPSSPELPAKKHREEIVAAVKAQRATILVGETGSGKTTQVPQFLMDDRDLVPEGKYVYVTQPRRIAAVTIAERVAAERGETVGRSVGYQIRFEASSTTRTRILFLTEGTNLVNFCSILGFLGSQKLNSRLGESSIFIFFTFFM